MEGNKSGCATCKHETLPSGIEPCCHCLDYENWEPKNGAPGALMGGFNPGAPEGDKTNVRRVWPLDGREIGPELINVWGEVDPQIRRARNFIDDTEDGLVFAITRMPLETVIGYAIDGIKDHVSKLGLLLTDKTLSADALANTILELQDLNRDWDRIVEEGEAMMKGGGACRKP